jgi:tetratricopeptide (TPR) repeat protein
VVIVLFVVRPVLTILADIFSILRPVIAALLNNPVGRMVFYTVLAAALLYWVWRKVRAGILRACGLKAMRHFLDGMQAMMLDRWRPAIRCFHKVVWWSRWIKLEDAVPEHRDIGADARLKIAACHQRLGEANEALGWLKRVREKDILTEHVRRNHAELHALAYDLSDELEEETVLKELEKTQVKDRANRRVLRALRERLEGAGDLERARDVGRRLAAVSEGAEKEAAEHDLHLLEYRLAHKALGAGDAKEVKSSIKGLAATDPRSALLLGDLALERGDVKAALLAWSRAVSLPVFERLAKLLESGKLAGDKEQQILKSHFPYAGTFLVLAEHHLKRKEHRKARTALDQVLKTAGENLRVLRLYAQCLEGEGDTEGAAALYRRALSQSLG